MKKPWSITTTLRNPERLENFLATLAQLENCEWNFDNQKKYQILLIQNRSFGYGSSEFYHGLSQYDIGLIDDYANEISFEQAKQIFNAKNYEDPAMRGRQSINPLKKFGLATIKNDKVKITNLGESFLMGNRDLGDILFRSFLKWQIPNPDNRHYPKNGDYDIKPFIATLHLINSVNQKEVSCGNEPKGISKREFSLFVPTLVHHGNIEQYADKIVNLRMQLKGKTSGEKEISFNVYKKRFVSEFVATNDENEDDENKIKKLLNNLKDYGDNIIRYFRLTRYIHIRGGGFYVDLEPRRSIEIASLLDYDNAQSIFFESQEEYLDYISDISKPELPWESTDKYIEIIANLIAEIEKYETALKKDRSEAKDFPNMPNDALKKYITELRTYRHQLQDEENRKKSQSAQEIKCCIEKFENIRKFDNRPVLLEKLSAFGLHALNDALKIQPNYPVGDDNEPTFTAPANVPDIECFYDKFNAICEVTMLVRRDQWYNEGQPVMRHLRNFENKYPGKTTYCLFIAPKIHRDTLNTFWNAIKYEYEGVKQKIVPLSINDFVSILKILLQIKTQNKFLNHSEISRLYDEIVNSSQLFNSATEWEKSIPSTILSWRDGINF